MSLRTRRRALFLLVVEPATLVEFALQALDGSCLVAVADDDHLPRLGVEPIVSFKI
jgi:hypothetical protein